MDEKRREREKRKRKRERREGRARLLAPCSLLSRAPRLVSSSQEQKHTNKTNTPPQTQNTPNKHFPSLKKEKKERQRKQK
jgi:hypothetical protein